MRIKLKNKKIKISKKFLFLGILIFALAILQFLAISTFFVFSFPRVSAGIGENVTVNSQLDIGNVYPEILSITINDGYSIDLTPNSTTLLSVIVIARDFNGEGDIDNVSLEFFDNSNSLYGGADNNSIHYTNISCDINTSYGDEYEIESNCTLYLEYYANEGLWNASVLVTDSEGWTTFNSSTQSVNELLAIGLPDSINYGQVNATFVSDEQLANVTNYGNVELNLTLSGYAQTPGDNYAMNCSLGAIGFISIFYEKFNLTESTPGALSFGEFEGTYTNLTKTTEVNVYEFNLNKRTDDVINNAIKPSFWRIYVPMGVAGSCTGNIVFGAVRDPAS
ncbi:hypothetical protein K0A97_02580 [Patescibacteria group bacterium]|nr:hypothetical protein [Patescibacteria group bacterium]